MRKSNSIIRACKLCLIIFLTIFSVACSKLGKLGPIARLANQHQQQEQELQSPSKEELYKANFTTAELETIIPGSWKCIKGGGEFFFGEPGGTVEIQFNYKTCNGLHNPRFIGTYNLIGKNFVFDWHEVESSGRSIPVTGAWLYKLKVASETELHLFEYDDKETVLYTFNKVNFAPNSPSKRKSEKQLLASLREPVPATTDAASKKIIANHLQVRGGEDRLRSIHTIQVTGKVREGKHDYKVSYWSAPTDKIRLETFYKKMGREYRKISGYNGIYGWEYDLAQKNPRPVKRSKDKIERVLRQDTFYGPFIDAEAQDLVFAYQGKVTSRGHEAFLVKMFHPNGLPEYFYFDTKNFMIMRHGWEEVLKGHIVRKDEFFSKYQKANDIWVPKIVEFAIEGKVYGKFTVNTYELNPTVRKDIYSAHSIEI